MHVNVHQPQWQVVKESLGAHYLEEGPDALIPANEVELSDLQLGDHEQQVS